MRTQSTTYSGCVTVAQARSLPTIHQVVFRGVDVDGFQLSAIGIAAVVFAILF